MEKEIVLKEFDLNSSDYLEQIAKLYVHCFNDEDKGENWTLETSIAYFRERESEGSLFFGAFEDGLLKSVVVGSKFQDSFISKELPELERQDDFYISLIATEKNFRGKGYSSKLMNYLFEQLAVKNFKTSSVRCRHDNKPVQNLLKRYNYVEIHSYESQLGGVTCRRLVLARETI